MYDLYASQKAMLLISGNKFHKSRMKTNRLIFRKFCPKFEKIAKRHYLARYCDKSNDSFEILPKLFYGTLRDIRGNITG